MNRWAGRPRERSGNAVLLAPHSRHRQFTKRRRRERVPLFYSLVPGRKKSHHLFPICVRFTYYEWVSLILVAQRSGGSIFMQCSSSSTAERIWEKESRMRTDRNRKKMRKRGKKGNSNLLSTTVSRTTIGC